MSTVVINGVIIQTSGRNNVTIRGDQVTVNGKNVTPNTKEINIVVNGDLEKLEADVCNKVSVTGNVGSIRTQSGNVEVTGNVSGSVSTMAGNVNCGNVSGSVSTMAGNIKHRHS